MRTLLIGAHNTDRVKHPHAHLWCSGENDGALINAFVAMHPEATEFRYLSGTFVIDRAPLHYDERMRGA